MGYDLQGGLLLVARDDRGRVLERASVVRAREGEGELRLEMLSLAEAARCSCVDDYLRGEPPDDARVRGAWSGAAGGAGRGARGRPASLRRSRRVGALALRPGDATAGPTGR